MNDFLAERFRLFVGNNVLFTPNILIIPVTVTKTLGKTYSHVACGI